MTRLRLALSALLTVALLPLAAGCDFQPTEIAVPGTGVDGPTYHLRIEFANVLNLPQGAKVIADGVPVGRLTGVTVVDPTADRHGLVIAEVDIRAAVRLPVGTTAELRQETPLGDVHIALTEPAAPAVGELRANDTIPLANTTQAPQIEDILARLSTFIGSGAVTDIQNIVRTMNGVLPPNPADTARIAGTLGADLTDLADHTESIHNLVAGLQSTVDEGLLANTTTFDQLLTPYGVQHTTDSINATIGVIFVLTALGPVAPAAAWLGPALISADGVVRSVVPVLFGSHPLDTSSPSNLKLLVDLIQNKIIPFVQRGPKVNMVGVTVDPPPVAMPPEEQTARIVDTLRMIGAVR
ncbi:MlaD family protein [Nocardia sp. NPDC003482]